MQFVKTKDLKEGMRLAKPIFDRNGTLLYERDSRLTKTAIPGIANFGLPGLFILEPAEPVPPLTEEEIEFERLQTIFVFQLREDYAAIAQEQEPQYLKKMAETIMQNYGRLQKRIVFVQNLRSTEDFTYKHSLNVAILCCMLCHELSLDFAHQFSLVYAGLLHDIGLIVRPAPGNRRANQLDKEKKANPYPPHSTKYKFFEHYTRRLYADCILRPESGPFDIPQTALAIIRQYIQALYHPAIEEMPKLAAAWTFNSKVLHVANTFDMLTAMQQDNVPMSYLSAVRYLKKNPNYYDAAVVRALSQCLNILPSGACVDLSNGQKGLVLTENAEDFELPVVLLFSSMKTIDLGDQKAARRIHIVDNMRTMDNRIKIDQETLDQFSADEALTRKTMELNQKLRMAKARERAAAARTSGGDWE